MKSRGFTLIELMITITIIAIISAIAIPNIFRAKISATEGNAIGSLHTLFLSQTQFQQQAIVDQNTNGTGEFGSFGELTGIANVRTRNNPISNPFITVSLQPATNRVYASKIGYLYQIYLPGNPTAITDDGTTGIPITADADSIAGQENRWFCYAWPAAFRSSGIRVFFTSHRGETFVMDNQLSQYSGTPQPMAFNAIFLPGMGNSLLKGEMAIKQPSSTLGGESWLFAD